MRSVALALAAVAALPVSVPAQAAIIISEDFESGFGVFMPSGPGVGIYTGANYAACCHTTGTPEDLANHFLALDNGGNGFEGQIETTFLTLPGETYTLTFYYGILGDGDPQGEPANYVNFLVDGYFDSTVPIGISELIDGAWMQGWTYTFVGKGGPAILRFQAYGQTHTDTVLDNITLTGPVADAVPEPGTWAMMLLGFMGIGLALRRQVKDQIA